MEQIKYNNLPRKIKKGVKRALIAEIGTVWKPKEIKVLDVVKIKPGEGRSDYKNFWAQGYRLCAK